MLDAEAGDLRLDLEDDVVAGATQLDGTVDDGQGPGRLLVVVFPPGQVQPGSLCLDRDFVQGGTCVRVDLGGGEALYRRGLVEAAGTQVIVTTLQRADGSGVLLESGNFRIETPPVLVGNDRPTPEITRPGPVFSLDELASLAQAIADATRDCTADACP